MTSRRQTYSTALVVVGLVLNLGLGFLVAAVRLPFYLDTIGTILVVYYAGLRLGCIVAVLSALIGSLYTPTTWAYIPTGLAVATYVHFTIPYGYLKRFTPMILFSIGLGLISALISAPITVLMFGGMSSAGADYLTSAILAMGKTLANSVFLGGLSSDTIDKLVTSLVAFAIVKRAPSLPIRE